MQLERTNENQLKFGTKFLLEAGFHASPNHPHGAFRPYPEFRLTTIPPGRWKRPYSNPPSPPKLSPRPSPALRKNVRTGKYTRRLPGQSFPIVGPGTLIRPRVLGPLARLVPVFFFSQALFEASPYEYRLGRARWVLHVCRRFSLVLEGHVVLLEAKPGLCFHPRRYMALSDDTHTHSSLLGILRRTVPGATFY